jgi:hypothetical protein
MILNSSVPAISLRSLSTLTLVGLFILLVGHSDSVVQAQDPNLVSRSNTSRLPADNAVASRKEKRVTDRTLRVRGRVVDSKNQPVSNAEITLINASRNKDLTQSVDDVTGVYSSDANGKFEIDSSFGSDAQLVLYVTTSTPADAYSPLTPPFRTLAPINVNPGRAIKLNGKNDLNVGDVQIHVHFQSVIALLDGVSPLSNPAEGDDRPEIWVRLRSARGDVVSMSSVPSKAIRLSPFSIVLSLPEGRWTFDASFEGPDGPWYEVDQPLNILSSQRDQIYVSLKSAPRSAGLQLTTPHEARKRLARLGISYSKVSFIEHAGRCNTEVTRLFIAAGLSPDVEDKGGKTAVLAAAADGCGEVVVFLLDHGANASDKLKEMSALMAAASSGSLVAVKALLNKRANPNASDEAGLTPLILAAGNGHVEIVKTLLAHGADASSTDRKGMTALDYAVQTSNEKIANILRGGLLGDGRTSNKVRSTTGSRGPLQTSPMFEPGVRLTRYKVASDLPLAFAEFYYFDLDEVSREPNDEMTMEANGDVSITGYLMTKDNQPFKIQHGKLVAGTEDYERVIFETEMKEGVSYTFNGTFLKTPKREGDQYIELDGELAKFTSSGKIATGRLRLYIATQQ